MTIILPDNRKPKPPATVLRGPADADAFRVKVKRSRWYADPLPACDIAPATDGAWPAVSTVKNAKPFEGANYVAMKRLATDFTTRPQPQHVETYDEMYSRFKAIDANSLKAAGDRGTHVHKMAEQMLYGQPVNQKGPGAAYYPALADFFDCFQPTLVAAEFVCIHRDLNGVGYGGTSDAAIEIDGQVYLIDWKSRGEDADHAAYPEEGGQLGAYAGAQYAIVDGGNGMAKRIFVPSFYAGLIISVRPDGCRMFPIDLDKARAYYEALHAWYVARRTEDDHTGKPWAPRTKTVAVESGRAPATDGGVEAVDAASASPADPFDGLTVTETHGVATRPYVMPTPAEQPTWTATPADEGAAVDEKTIWRLTQGYKKRSAEQRAVMREILKEGQRASVPFGQVEKNPTMRRFELGRALLAVADHATREGELDQALVRGALVLVMGDKPEVANAPLGALIGCLDPDEARSLVRVLEGVSDGVYVADYSTGSLLLKQRAA